MSTWIRATVGDHDLSDRIATWKPETIATAHYVLDPHYQPTKNEWRCEGPVVGETMTLAEVAITIAELDRYPESL